MLRSAGDRRPNRRQFGQPLATIFLAALASLLIGCNSKNPDALTGPDVDDNQAIMDLNNGMNAIASAPSNSGGDIAPPAKPVERADAAGADRAATQTRASSNDRERSAEVDATALTSGTTPETDETHPAEVPDNQDQPSNAM